MDSGIQINRLQYFCFFLNFVGIFLSGWCFHDFMHIRVANNA